MILPSEAHGLRILLDSRLRALGISLEPEIEVDSFGSIKRLVERGYGCSVLPFHAVAEEARTGRLAVRRFAEPRLRRSAFLVQAASRPPTRAAAAVADMIVEAVRDLVDDGSWAGAYDPEAVEESPDRRHASPGGPLPPPSDTDA